MKKKIMFLIVASFVIFSCSNSDDVAPQETILLTKRIIDTDRYGSSESLISYNGNKINKVNVNYSNAGNNLTAMIKFIYNGDLVLKTESFRANLINSSNEYSYENNKIKSVLHIEYGLNQTAGYKTKEIYTYSLDGTILLENYDINIDTSVETKNDDSTIYTFENGNLTKRVYNISYFVNGNSNNGLVYYKSTTVYEYDNKNNPFKNVLGYGQININYASQNNILKSTSY